ncbi:hypothetical protein [Rossellomorea marisflavi]|uniref:hypothetical protein n=1 Tax=Rossellomorea marisflavi TaxID=189381 RepID=UPI003FA0A5F4
METKLKKKIESIMLSHINSLKNEPAFPQECVLSSHLLGGFLKEKAQVVYGTFGEHELFHSWLEIDDVIVDMTAFQFLTPKEKKGFYEKATGKEMVSYIAQNQGSVFITKDSPLYQKYIAIFYPETVFQSKNGMTKFDVYLRQMKKQEYYETLSWRESKDRNGISFSNALEREGKRITRKFVSKWAIVAN